MNEEHKRTIVSRSRYTDFEATLSRPLKPPDLTSLEILEVGWIESMEAEPSRRASTVQPISLM